MTRIFPPEICAFIIQHNFGKTSAELTDLVNFVFKTNYTRQQIIRFRARKRLNSGLTGQFEKGYTPHNKGKKAENYPHIVGFEKGNVPANRLPVGKIRRLPNGYLEKKIAQPDVWRKLHVLNWETVNGPIPEGSTLIFKNGDVLNCDVSNLMLVTNKEKVRMCKYNLISIDPALTEIGHNIAKLRVVTSERKKEQNKKREAL